MLSALLVLMLQAAVPPMMHVPVLEPEPQICQLTWGAGALNVECPDVRGLQALAMERLAQIDLPDLETPSTAAQVTFNWVGRSNSWTPRAVALIWPRMSFPARALQDGVMARCAVGGFPLADGQLAALRVACVTGYDADHPVHRDFVQEAERFASHMRVLSDASERCHTLPIVFQLEGFEAPAQAPAHGQLCPQG